MSSLWSVSGVFPACEVSNLTVVVRGRIWGLWSICAAVSQGHLSGVRIVSGVYPRMWTFWSVCYLWPRAWGSWCVCGYMLQSLKSVVFLWLHVQVVRSLAYLWVYIPGFQLPDLFGTGCKGSELFVVFEVSDLVWVMRSVISLLVWVPRCEFSDLFVGRVWWHETSDVLTDQWSRVWSLQPVSLPGSELSGLFAFSMPEEVFGLWTLYGCTS